MRKIKYKLDKCYKNPKQIIPLFDIDIMIGLGISTIELFLFSAIAFLDVLFLGLIAKNMSDFKFITDLFNKERSSQPCTTEGYHTLS